MNENINLVEILKGHEGETFYSPLCGECELIRISEGDYPIELSYSTSDRWYFSKEGKYIIYEKAECILFPSKDQRDWNIWLKEQKKRTPKTWSEFVKTDKSIIYSLNDGNLNLVYRHKPFSLIEKSALALLKIYQLIEHCYGGNPTHEEKCNEKGVFVFDYCHKSKSFICFKAYSQIEIVAFHTEEQAKEFLSYKENIQLLKDYYQIP